MYRLMSTTKANPRCRNKCRSRLLIDEGPTWSVWFCTTCEHRHTETTPQLGLFPMADGIPHQAVADDEPEDE